MKPNRNDPCPCGSGRKYKKCCMNSDDGQLATSGFLDHAVPNGSGTFMTDLDYLSNSVVDLIDAGKLDAAEEVSHRLQMQFPDQVDGIWRLAMVREARGDRVAAAKLYREAAEFMRNNEGFDDVGIADMIQSAERLEAGL